MNEPNMLKSCEPKSDQLNYDSFIGGATKTIKITKVVGTEGDQPISIHYENENGRPFKPSKGMRRVLVTAWGAKAEDYVGRSMTLYGDPDVLFGGIKVGGIRISHLSNIPAPMEIPLTNKRGSRKPFVVQPLKDELAPLRKFGEDAAKSGMESLKMWWAGIGGAKQQLLGAAYLDELKKIAEAKPE